MKTQTPLIEKGTAMSTSGHRVVVIGIRHDGVECILEDGRIVTVGFESVEQAFRNQP